MKKRKNEQNLGEAIRSMISDLGIEEKLLSIQAEEIFVEMMGNYIMRYVESCEVKNHTLFIKMNSPELKNELSYGRTKILDHINETIGKKHLKEIKFL